MPPPPPPPPAPPPFPSAPPPPPPASKGNKTLVIVLCVLLGLFLIIGGCFASCAYFVGKKAKEFSAEAKANPQYAALSMYASLNPNIQVISKDPATGKMTLKNKQTGEVATINANDFTAENIEQGMQQFAAGQGLPTGAASPPSTANGSAPAAAAAAAPGAAPAPRPISAGKAAALTATLKNFPSFVTPYPGATTTDAGVNTFATTTVGSYKFTTDDSTDTVASYYQKQLTGNGFKILTQNSGSNDNGSTAMLMANRASPANNFTLDAETLAGGKVQVTVGFTVVSQ